MLILLITSITIASIIVYLVNKERESLLLFFMCVSLAIMLVGITIFIAKKGGISEELSNFFFITNPIKYKLRYLALTLNQLGYIIAVGRYLFPLFLLYFTIKVSLLKSLKESLLIKRVILIPPVFSLVMYFPPVFNSLSNMSQAIQQVVMWLSVIWIIGYCLLAIVLLVIDIASVKLKFFQLPFIWINVFAISLCLLYLLYCGQDPAQVYQFYHFETPWGMGLYYMRTLLSVKAYKYLIAVNILFAVTGFISLIRYASRILEMNHEELILQKNSKLIVPATYVFVHGIKNQLLTHKALVKRVSRKLESPTFEMTEIKQDLALLEEKNNELLTRVEELYRSVKYDQVHLIISKADILLQESVLALKNKYPEADCEVVLIESADILADRELFSEALLNLLINGYDAMSNLPDSEKKLTVSVSVERFLVTFKVTDQGIGIPKELQTKIFDPFFTMKNSSYNWGMGLYFTKMIAKQHFGSIKLESKQGKGSTFYLTIPKYK